jgi:hypothetical protein
MGIARCTHQEKRVDNDVKEKRRKGIAGIIIAPEAYLHRNNDCCVK